MKDFVRNFISVFGNKAVQATHMEVVRRVGEAYEQNAFSAISEVLYGLPRDAPSLGEEKTGASWVTFATDYADDDILSIDSGESTPEQLLNHIVWFYSKVDPECVLQNKFDHFNTDFVGVSYRTVTNKKKIRIFDKRVDVLADVYSEDITDDETFDSTNAITWTELWEIQRKEDLLARKLLLEEFPHFSKYFKQ